MQEINDVCKEVITILGFFNNDMLKKIPDNVLRKINELAADSNLNYYINKDKDFLSQNISENSKDFIALLYYNYIASETEKLELSKIWNENEKEYQKELNQKYDVNNIFKRNKDKESADLEEIKNTNNMELIEYKESFFTKLKNYVFKVLHINL